MCPVRFSQPASNQLSQNAETQVIKGVICSGRSYLANQPANKLPRPFRAVREPRPTSNRGCHVPGWDHRPLGLVRSMDWAASPGWEQMAQTPFVGGPGKGNEPHVGCSIQYNSLHSDASTGKTFFEYWDVSFNPANTSTPPQSWNVYELVWGGGTYPIPWPGPAQSPPPPPPAVPNCTTVGACKRTCPGFVQCPSDGRYYCCTEAAKTGCTLSHNCTGTPGLQFCACPKPPT
jgi:hypothetical protein